jgi:2-polyprenyl-3-methyl-5-hydroxy-6-metoxy-1,4-benzoquinol methylase
MKRVDLVRLEFEQPDKYLNGSQYNIRIRAETVKALIADRQHKRILDIGCGDASISLPLLHADNRLTLIDLSNTMLSRARSRVRAELIRNIEFFHGDFVCAPLTRTYDLVICVGVLAHVSSPAVVVRKIADILEPGGTVVIQVTDCRHLITRAVQANLKLWGIATATYPLMQLCAEEVTELFTRQGLQLVDTYRYTQPHGLGRLLSGESLYCLTRFMYGWYPKGRNAALGNEILFRFDDASASKPLPDGSPLPGSRNSRARSPILRAG